MSEVAQATETVATPAPVAAAPKAPKKPKVDTSALIAAMPEATKLKSRKGAGSEYSIAGKPNRYKYIHVKFTVGGEIPQNPNGAERIVARLQNKKVGTPALFEVTDVPVELPAPSLTAPEAPAAQG